MLNKRCNAKRELHETESVVRACARAISVKALSIAFTRAIVCARPSNGAAGGAVVANAIVPLAPGGAGVAAGMVSACQGKWGAAGRLRPTPADGCRELAASVNGAPEVGWRGFGDLRS